MNWYTNNELINGIPSNRDVQSSRQFIKNRSKYNYDSFVFGSSLSMAYLTRDWEQYIGIAHPFHYDANAETLYGVLSKLAYLDKIGVPLKNVLIISDPDLYKQTSNSDRFLFVKDYKITGDSPITFHEIFFKAFMSDGFFISYFDYLLFKTYRPYMKGHIITAKDSIDQISNDFYRLQIQQQITSDSISFYKSKMNLFYKRGPDTIYYPQIIQAEQLKMLQEIKNILKKNNTNYKIILSPLYSQAYVNKADIFILNTVFGKSNVFDFSGKNQYTNDPGNYYDAVHYKVYIARQILEKTYHEN